VLALLAVLALVTTTNKALVHAANGVVPGSGLLPLTTKEGEAERGLQEQLEEEEQVTLPNTDNSTGAPGGNNNKTSSDIGGDGMPTNNTTTTNSTSTTNTTNSTSGGGTRTTTTTPPPLVPNNINDLRDCVDEETGALLPGRFVENYLCLPEGEDAVWYYALVPAPIASNGLQAGYATHLHLWFGSLGHPTSAAFDYMNYGLSIPDKGGQIAVELSPHFVYDRSQMLPAEPLFTTEIGLGPANLLLPEPCVVDKNSVRGQNVCSGWVSELADPAGNPNVISIHAPDGLYGKRATDVGIKYFHLHPLLTGERGFITTPTEHAVLTSKQRRPFRLIKHRPR